MKGLLEVIVRAVMSLHNRAKTKVRVGSELSDEFLVQVGVHHGYLLSQLVMLFAIAMNAIIEFGKKGSMNETSYPYDSILISESIKKVREKFLNRKVEFQSKRSKVNLKNTKVMARGSKGGILVNKVDPCAKCGKRARANSVLCAKCGKWVYGRRTKMKSDLNSHKNFVCKGCVETIEEIVKPAKELSFYNQLELV